jgi:hypothetical protein
LDTVIQKSNQSMNIKLESKTTKGAHAFSKLLHGLVEDVASHDLPHEPFESPLEVLLIVSSLSELRQKSGERIGRRCIDVTLISEVFGDESKLRNDPC